MSNLADGMLQIALPLLTLGITRDPIAFATVTLAFRLPWLLFALPAGALADRLDRRRTMLLVNLGRAALIGGLALVVATGGETLWLLCTVTFALGMSETFFDTAAQSIVPNLVDPADLSRVNGRLYAVELTMNQFVGPPLGGLIIGATAAAGALGASAAAYLVAAVALARIVGSFRPERTGPPTRLHRDIVEGIGYLYRQRVLRVLALLTGILNLTALAVLAVLPLYAVHPGPMGLSETGFGLLLTAGAVGSLLGTFLVTRLERTLGRARTLLLTFVLMCLAIGVPGVTSSVLVIGIAMVVEGAAAVSWNVITVSLRQRIVPDHLLGRVNAGYRMLAWGAMPLGALLGGWLGHLFGLRAVFLVAAATGLSALPLIAVMISASAIATAEQQEPAVDPSARPPHR